MQPLFKEIRTLFLFSSLICFSGLEALPNGCQVISGDAQVNANSNTVTIESGNRTILHWDNFSIDSGEVTRFLQTDKHSAILNRVIGGSESTIYGSLESNGKVYLINPQGILIGPGARVETAGFLASTLDMLNEDFIADKALSFSGSSTAWVRNLGTIACPTGAITLIARFVSNEGDLTASEGSVSLIAAPEVLLQVEGREKFLIRPESKEIQTLAEELQQGSNPYIQAIKNAGTIKALSTTEENGRVYLVAAKGSTGISGSLVAKQGDKGGEIRALGDQVLIQEGALVDVSGDMGGGTVLIGGDYQGNNPDILNAQITWVDKNTIINADALVEGDGGKVILWGDKVTGSFGSIIARGGKNSGDGGFVEISSHDSLFPVGSVDTSAPFGEFGTLLLDPTDVVIGAADANIATPGPTYTYTGVAGTTVGAAGLVAKLNLTNVVISTDTQTAVAGEKGIITVSSAIGAGGTWTAPTTLTLIANKQILINADITNAEPTGKSFTALQCFANQGHDVTDPATFTGITLAATITTNGGGVLMQGTGGSDGAGNKGIFLDGTLTNSQIISTTGDVTLIGRASPVFPGQALANNNIGVTIFGRVVNPATISTGGNILIDGSGGNGANSSTTDNYGMWIDLNALVTSSKSVTMIGRGDGTGTANNGVILGDSVLIQATGTGNILIDGTSSPGTNTNFGINVLTSSVTAAGGDIHLIGKSLGTGSGNGGINFIGTVSTLGIGNILFEGTAGAGTFGNIGVTLSQAIGSSVDGNFNVIGKGNGTTHDNSGIRGVASTLIQTTGIGNILMDGTSGVGTSGNHGVSFATSTLASLNGNIDIIGRGNGTGTTDRGVDLSSSVLIQSTGGGNILIDGIAGAGSDSNVGVSVASSTVASLNGNIDIIGEGNGDGTGINNFGASFLGSSFIQTTGTGNIFIKGIGGAGADGNKGINVSAASITSISGNISIVGYGNGTGTDNDGVDILNTSLIQSTGIGNIFIEGTGGAATDSNDGVFLVGATVTALTGNIAVTGVGQGTGIGNNGVVINVTQISAIGGPGSINNIHVDGRASSYAGSSGYGVELLGGAVITSSHQDIVIRAESRTATALIVGGSITSSGPQLIDLEVRGLTSLGGTTQIGGTITTLGPISIDSSQDLLCTFSTITGVGLIDIRAGRSLSFQSTALSGTTLHIETLDMIVDTGSTLTSSGATLQVETERDLQVFNAGLFSGSNIEVTTGGSLTIFAAGFAGVTGFTVPTAGAFVGNIGTDLILTGGTVANASAVIANNNGPTTITIGRNLILTGGSGANSFAQIGDTTGSGDILFPFIGGNTQLFGSNGYAVVGYGNTVMNVPDIVGKITFQRIVGDLSLTASPNPGEGFAQIGHLSPLVGAPDLSGDIFIDVVSQNINLTGSGSYAQIGHGVPPAVFVSSATFNNPTAVTAFAGNSINMTSGGSDATGAYIVNNSTIGSVLFPYSGSITLITDNINPLNPGIGASGITMDPFSFITNVLASGGQVRIYTDAQGLNVIPPGGSINGVVFMPGPVGFNNAHEKWGMYYGGGAYSSGSEFTFYYKTPDAEIICPSPSPCPTHTTIVIPQALELAIANAQLSDLLSRWVALLTDPYHGQSCIQQFIFMQPLIYDHCYPGFFRFESFVFENNVDRVGR